MNGSSWDDAHSDHEAQGDDLTSQDVQVDSKTPRKRSSSSSPKVIFRKIFSSEKESKAKDINYEYYGKLCALPGLEDILSNDEMALYGRAEYLKDPEDKKTLLQLATMKGHLAFFKECLEKSTDTIDDDFIKVLAKIASDNQKDDILSHLCSTYGDRIDFTNINNLPKKKK